MPGTYSQILLHVVFSTKGPSALDHRRPPPSPLRIHRRHHPRREGRPLRHRRHRGPPPPLPAALASDATISDLMRDVKAHSSLWVHKTFPKHAAFTWQEGYSVFTVSKSQEDFVKRYIAEQAEHHKKEDFKSELLRMLRLNEIEFDERYMFD